MSSVDRYDRTSTQRLAELRRTMLDARYGSAKAKHDDPAGPQADTDHAAHDAHVPLDHDAPCRPRRQRS